jgi:hypothetical protein
LWRAFDEERIGGGRKLTAGWVPLVLLPPTPAALLAHWLHVKGFFGFAAIFALIFWIITLALSKPIDWERAAGIGGKVD